MSLAEALAERVNALARTRERLRALDDETADHVVQEADANAVLKQAVAVLTTGDGYDAARRLLRGETVTAHDDLTKAGLAVWDPASGGIRPTALLIELIQVVDR
jgi:hypothetical protein